MKRLINYLLQGLLYIAPLGITIYIIYALFSFIDDLLQQLLTDYIDIRIPGLGVATLLITLILIGFFGQTIIGKPFKYIFNRLLQKVPMLKVIYSAFNDLFSAFVGKERKFNKPVMVQVNLNSNLEKMGFLTEEDLSMLNEPEKVAVYFPHSYNFSGEMFIVPKNRVRSIDIPPAEVMKFIVSGGVSGLNSSQEKTETE